jgi:ATP-dependent phosphoenolpyruvate carboxykinase
MNRIACIFVAFGLAGAGSTALAAKPQPALMTDAQMDDVTAGGVVDVLVLNSLNDWSINLDLKLQANVAANVNAGVSLVGTASATQMIGSQTQLTGNLQ